MARDGYLYGFERQLEDNPAERVLRLSKLKRSDSSSKTAMATIAMERVICATSSLDSITPPSYYRVKRIILI